MFSLQQNISMLIPNFYDVLKDEDSFKKSMEEHNVENGHLSIDDRLSPLGSEGGKQTGMYYLRTLGNTYPELMRFILNHVLCDKSKIF